MGKSQLIHNNEFHLISKAEIRKATGKLVESLNLAAGSTDGFDIYKVVDAYFTDLDKRHEVNALLGIGESCQYYGGKKEEESAMVTGPVEKTTLGDIEELAALKEKLAGK